jgi:hypothetical protein
VQQSISNVAECIAVLPTLAQQPSSRVRTYSAVPRQAAWTFTLMKGDRMLALAVSWCCFQPPVTLHQGCPDHWIARPATYTSKAEW